MTPTNSEEVSHLGSEEDNMIGSILEMEKVKKIPQNLFLDSMEVAILQRET